MLHGGESEHTHSFCGREHVKCVFEFNGNEYVVFMRESRLCFAAPTSYVAYAFYVV